MDNQYPKNWPEIAYNCKKHYGFTCQCCQQNAIDKPGLQLRVRLLDGNPANTTDTNLLVLCRSCNKLMDTLEAPQRKRMKKYFKAVSRGQLSLDLPQELAPQPIFLTLSILRKMSTAPTIE